MVFFIPTSNTSLGPPFYRLITHLQSELLIGCNPTYSRLGCQRGKFRRPFLPSSTSPLFPLRKASQLLPSSPTIHPISSHQQASGTWSGFSLPLSSCRLFSQLFVVPFFHSIPLVISSSISTCVSSRLVSYSLPVVDFIPFAISSDCRRAQSECRAPLKSPALLSTTSSSLPSCYSPLYQQSHSLRLLCSSVQAFLLLLSVHLFAPFRKSSTSIFRV